MTIINNTDRPAWQQAFADAIKSIDELLTVVQLSPEQLSQKILLNSHFPLRVPRSFVQRIQKNNPNDPLLLQLLPLQQENDVYQGYSTDPVGDLAAQVGPGILHKYQGRALLIATGACGIHCRYCFRRFYPYSTSQSLNDHWQATLEYLANDTSIYEVILSGGDPLSLSDDKLSNAVKQLEAIPHIRYLRIHTRLPVVLPQRIDENLLTWIGHTRFKTVMVLHINHAQEINQDVHDAIQALKSKQVTVLNQSVLLRNINDTEESLSNLSFALFDAGILPYYIHLLDKVSGSAHFAVSQERAIHLIDGIRKQLPGYLVPKLVKEETGVPYKIPLL